MRPSSQSLNQAGFWSGSASSWTVLFAASNLSGAVHALDANSEVGATWQAALWQGTPKSGVMLHPSGPIGSAAYSARSELQAGSVAFPFFISHAGYWRGTAASFVDLHPQLFESSGAHATDGTLQGGFVSTFGVGPLAAIWNQTAASVTVLEPQRGSKVSGMAPGVQVGEVHQPGSVRAALWRGTPESFTDLSPPGSSASMFLATTGRIHVGRTGQSGLARAAINFGTPESWQSLHDFLPGMYASFSAATSVCQDGDTIYVGGWAENTATGYNEAILWTGVLECYANCDDSSTVPILNVADFSCFLQRFATGDPYANCDGSTTPPALNVADFSCFLQKFAAGCP
jgi:hypothetical protein